MELSYAQVEGLIAALHRILPARRSALEGRLKHFKRLGFPAGVNTGRGIAAKYNASAVLRLLIAFELLQLGMMPEKAVSLVRVMSHILISAAGYAGGDLVRGPDPDETDPDVSHNKNPFYILFDPVALGPLISPGDEGELSMDTLYALLDSELQDDFDRGYSRTALINCTFLIGSAAIHLRDEESLPCAVFGQALLDWAHSLEWSDDRL